MRHSLVFWCRQWTQPSLFYRRLSAFCRRASRWCYRFSLLGDRLALWSHILTVRALAAEPESKDPLAENNLMTRFLERFYRFRAQRLRLAAGRTWERADCLYARALDLDARADVLAAAREDMRKSGSSGVSDSLVPPKGVPKDAHLKGGFAFSSKEIV